MIPSKRILVVDDEPVNQKLIENFLAVQGHSPEFASNGFEALEKIKSGFDLVLLDIRMPGMDGIEVVRRIRENPESADIPIIMITVLDDRETHIQAVQAGANDFINKPIDRLELHVRMESLLKMREA
jgi:CheY-like chemotaxis protein